MPSLTCWVGLLPGAAGTGLGRNPNGAVHDIREAYLPLSRAPGVLVGMSVVLAVLYGLRPAEVLTNWPYLLLGIATVGGAAMLAGIIHPRALEVTGVTVRFGGDIALDVVSMTAEPGCVTGLIGSNRAGKTTLFNVVTGLLPPSGGHGLLEGHDVTRLSPTRRARRGLARTF